MPLGTSSFGLLLLGIFAGLLSGIFGIGGGIVIVPALIYFAGFEPQKATGTSLAILLPPVGLAAVVEYYRNGNVDLRAALLVAITFIAGAWLSAILANRLNGAVLKLAFGIFLIVLGLFMSGTSWQTLRRTSSATPAARAEEQPR